MRSFIDYVESASPTVLKRIMVNASPGSPAVISEDEMRNVVIEHDVAYRGEIKKGKKWVSALMSMQRLGKVEASFFQGRLNGQVWILPEHYEEAKRRLIEECKVIMQQQIEALLVISKSLG